MTFERHAAAGRVHRVAHAGAADGPAAVGRRGFLQATAAGGAAAMLATARPRTVVAQPASAPAAETGSTASGTIHDYCGPDNGVVGNPREGMLQERTSYRMFVPPVERGALRGTIIWMSNNNGDDRGYANRPEWQAFATEMRMALMGCEHKLGKATVPYFEWQHDHFGSMTASVTDAVAKLGTMAGHPELGALPLTISGGSAGANFAVNMVANLPGRFIGAAVTISEFGFGWWASPTDNAPRGSPDHYTVPMFVTSGLGEPTKTAVVRAEQTYAIGQARGAPWTLAMHPTRGHVRIGEDVIRLFLRAYVGLRLDARPKPGTPCKRIDLTQGWLGDRQTYDVAACADYRGDKRLAMWIPDRETALAWQSFLKNP